MLTRYQLLARAHNDTNNRRRREIVTMTCSQSDSVTYQVAEYWAKRYAEELDWLSEELQKEETKGE